MIHKATLVVADTILTVLVFTPLHIIHWRGTWDIWDHYVKFDCNDDDGNNSTNVSSLFRNKRYRHRHGLAPLDDDDCKEFAGNWLSAGLCCFICWLLNCVSPVMEDGARRLSRGGYIAASRFYMYLYAFSSLGQWRGTWNLVDEYSSLEWRGNLIGLGACLGVSFLMRTFRYAIPQPWSNKCDEQGDRFRAIGWLKLTPDQNGWWKFCTDQALSQVVVVNLNVVLWRCWWNIMDETIMPEHYDLSSGICAAAGAVATFILMFLSNFAGKYSAKLDEKHQLEKIAFENFFNFFVFAATTMYWRGFWNLIEEHLLPESQYGGKEIGGWVCHAVGVVGLMVSLNFAGAYDNSVSLDGEESGGRGVKPDVTYLQYLCRDRIGFHEAKVQPARLPEEFNIGQNMQVIRLEN